MRKKIQMNTISWALAIGCLLFPVASSAEGASKFERDKRLQTVLKEVEANSGWVDHISFDGIIETEVGYAMEDLNGDETSAGSISLATVALGLDMDIVKHVSGHLVMMYEQGEADGAVLVDEGFISLNGEDIIPLYLNAGKFYVPFGNYATHMLSDPLTLEMGETQQTALLAGFANSWIDTGVAVLNGDVDDSREQNDHLDTFVLKVSATLSENAVSGFGLSGGLSYMSSIADTDGLEEVFDDAGISLDKDDVPGIGGWISASIADMFFLEIEYITAIEAFDADEQGLGEDRKFGALNLELAYAPIEKLIIAARYGRTMDTEGFFPESQLGAAVSYGLFERTTLGIEYLINDFHNTDTNTLITARLAVEF